MLPRCSIFLSMSLCLLVFSSVSLHEVTEPNAAFADDASRPVTALLNPYLNFVDGVYLNLKDKDSTEISKSCRDDTKLLLSLAEARDVQALQFLDATGKPDSAILEGSVHFLGYYSECLKSHISNEVRNLSGKYCLVEVTYSNVSEGRMGLLAPRPASAMNQDNSAFGFCIPSSCNENDVQLAASQSGSKQLFIDGTKVLSCSAELKILDDPLALSVIAIFSLFVILVVWATIFDVLNLNIKKEPSELSKALFAENDPVDFTKYTYSFSKECLLSFSLRRNISKILRVDNNQEKREFEVIHGYRFISMCSVILFHILVYAFDVLYFRNNESYVRFKTSAPFQILINSYLPGDTFFFISGLLVTYHTLREMGSGKQFSLWSFFLHRIVRLTPLMLVTIAFSAGLQSYIVPRPTSIYMCDGENRKNWWLTAIYLQNFIDFDRICLGHTWYIATSFQLYVLTPPILLLMAKNVKYSYGFMSVYFIISTVSTFTLSFINGFPAMSISALNMSSEAGMKYLNLIFIKPYSRMGPYLIGVHAGNFFLKSPEVHLTKKHATYLWMFSITMFVLVVFGVTVDYLHIPFLAALYSAYARTAWALGMFCMTIACTYGYGGFIENLLSWKALVPLSRLSYSVYLVHPVILTVYTGFTKTAIDFSFINILFTCIGIVVCSYAVAFVLTLLFETPFAGLESALRQRKAMKANRRDYNLLFEKK